ncbi:MAG: ribonuclease III [Prevotella sp.]|nr:ribonuclease III [Prevotella sp.]MBP5508234.1 ribonuclease III [Prevotella sp.]
MLSNIIDRIRLPFRKEKELYLSLYKILGFFPKDIHYYKQALMHKSIMRREKGKPINNERLEFLGDAILGAVVGHIVYIHFDGKREGFLTNTRSKIVQRETLNKLARELGITDLILSSGHSSSHNSYLGGNAFEALVGAIYLDKGYKACMQFVEKRILGNFINIDKVAYKEVNFKSKLIEWSQKNRVNIDFKVVEEKKVEGGSPMFVYQVLIEGIEGGIGRGYTKKESQQQASKITLERLRREPQYIDAIFAAKTNRTKMEEMPVQTVPDTETSDDFILTQPAEENNPPRSRKTASKQPKQDKKQQVVSILEEEEYEDEFDLSDITATPAKESREDIIAAAEEAAFADEANHQ